MDTKSAYTLNERYYEEVYSQWLRYISKWRRWDLPSGIVLILSGAILNGKWNESQLKRFRKVITYFKNHRDYMKYDEYLAKGYPIGSGVVESACSHVVRDRMEISGVRWRIRGAGRY
ncbi:MAG: hypothetical protein GY795_30045 [Desulfobacterales bacterium]|nr:hypothetical protein [Desulfobacterales bacterium]